LNILFLDFDGVINSLQWFINKEGKWQLKYLASEQSIQWVSDFCEKCNYRIVVSSTWRIDGLDACELYLRQSGLRDKIVVLDVTPNLHGKERGYEITEWLNQNDDIVENYLIFDDDSDMTVHMDRFIKCDGKIGFTYNEYLKAEILCR